jgi:hypothetical protein
MLERLIHDFLKELGEDPAREGLQRTPERVAKAFTYFTSAIDQDVHAVLNDALHESTTNGLVADIDFTASASEPADRQRRRRRPARAPRQSRRPAVDARSRIHEGDGGDPGHLAEDA